MKAQITVEFQLTFLLYLAFLTVIFFSLLESLTFISSNVDYSTFKSFEASMRINLNLINSISSEESYELISLGGNYYLVIDQEIKEGVVILPFEEVNSYV